MFGIGVALGQVKHQCSALTVDDCCVMSWPNALWPVFSAKYQGFAAETLRTFGLRADEMSNRIVELSTKLVEQRVACALLRMIGQSGRKVAGGIEIDFPITRQNIADMTNTTLHTVSRLLSDWERRGLVASSRSLIVVTDPHRLVMMSTASGARDLEPGWTSAGRKPYSIPSATAARSSPRKVASSKRYSAQASETV
jgi:CRP-like cAMP-binding protein